jgi:hypothetical protein
MTNAVARICRFFADTCLAQHKAIASVAPLRQAAHNLQSTPTQITVAHSLFLRACISRYRSITRNIFVRSVAHLNRISCSKCYKAGRDVVLMDLFEVDRYKERLDIESTLLYLYHAGIVCVALKMFKRALHFFSLLVRIFTFLEFLVKFLVKQTYL